MISHMDMVALPKAHLHLHLEGAIRPTTILDLYHRQGGGFATLTLEEVVSRAQMTPSDVSFFDAIGKFDFIMRCLREPDDLVRITGEAMADADADGVRYVELRFAPHFIHSFCRFPAPAAIEAVLKGIRQGMADHPNVIATPTLIIDRALGNTAAEEVVRWADRYRAMGTTSIDIAGDVSVYEYAEYEPACTLAHELGLSITIHVDCIPDLPGRVCGPQGLRIAVERLHATRIGHGFCAAKDPALLDLLLERGITLEISVSSNVYCRVVPSLDEHPLPRLLASGVRVTLNTDDPTIFNVTLSEEYALLQRTFGLTLADFRRANLHAVDAAFVDEERRQELRAMIEAGYSAAEE